MFCSFSMKANYDKRKRERLFMFCSFSMRGLNSYKRGRYIRVKAPLAIHTNHSLTPLVIYILTLTLTFTLIILYITHV